MWVWDGQGLGLRLASAPLLGVGAKSVNNGRGSNQRKSAREGFGGLLGVLEGYFPGILPLQKSIETPLKNKNK